MKPPLKVPRETLPETEQHCWPCQTPLQRTNQPTPGLHTWQCPTCARIYSDAHQQAFSHAPDGRFTKADK